MSRPQLIISGGCKDFMSAEMYHSICDRADLLCKLRAGSYIDPNPIFSNPNPTLNSDPDP